MSEPAVIGRVKLFATAPRSLIDAEGDLHNTLELFINALREYRLIGEACSRRALASAGELESCPGSAIDFRFSLDSVAKLVGLDCRASFELRWFVGRASRCGVY